jgi:uncharacterized protein YeaO (DUF488 family)
VVVRIVLERAYDAERHEGFRVLVDRVWPRGVSKDELGLDAWARELAPTTALRTWFGHDPERWGEFRRRYTSELRAAEQKERLRQLLAAAGRKPLVLVYGAKDEEHNQAVVLREVLEKLRG